jgi:hypothetical protein
MFMRPVLYHGPVVALEEIAYLKLEVAGEFQPLEIPWQIPLDEFWDAVQKHHVLKEGVDYNIKPMYFARLSAPGYLDKTDWVFGECPKQVVQELFECYGPDFPVDECPEDYEEWADFMEGVGLDLGEMVPEYGEYVRERALEKEEQDI